MRKRELEDLLSKQADKLTGRDQPGDICPAQYANEQELSALLSLAQRTSRYLYPIRPATGFQSRLLHDLMRQAHAQLEHENRSLWEEKRKEIIIGATITSLISAAGVLAYLMRVTPFNRPPSSTG